jgi:hypothetical protein
MVLDLVDYQQIERPFHGAQGNKGFARLTSPQGLSIPCRASRTWLRCDVWFEYEGQSWHGFQAEGPGKRCHCHIKKRSKSFHDQVVQPVPIPISEDVHQIVQRVISDAFQKLLTELINRGWTIHPPK